MAYLGVNIDHIATIRQARKTTEPDPVWGAALAELAGADCITVHLREDRRHIQDRDLRILRETVTVKLNLEMACTAEMVAIALQIKPCQVTLVPEKREEVTTEGGLNVAGNAAAIADAVKQLAAASIPVSLFLDPDAGQIAAGCDTGAAAVELHTGQYGLAVGDGQKQELDTLIAGGAEVRRLGMQLHAGHGLTVRNVQPVARIKDMGELNIGHSIISRAVMVGMQQAVREMKDLIASA